MKPYGRLALRTGPSYPALRSLRRKPRVVDIGEGQFLEHVCLVAAQYGWHGIHIRRSDKVMVGIHSPNREWPRGGDHDDASGLPDLILVHPGRGLVAFIELKTRTGHMRNGQKLWQSWLGMARSAATYVWRPADEDQIQRVLQEGW